MVCFTGEFYQTLKEELTASLRFILKNWIEEYTS